MPDGTVYFDVGRTVRKEGAGYNSPHAIHAIGIGCQVKYARELVYADGVDLDNIEASQPVGVTCRLCERHDCEQRVMPALQFPIKINENVRGISSYGPVPEE